VRVLQCVVAGVAAVGLLFLAAAILRPPTTDPILDPDSEPLPDSIAEVTTVELGGLGSRSHRCTSSQRQLNVRCRPLTSGNVR
jgi:hypothetical protein